MILLALRCDRGSIKNFGVNDLNEYIIVDCEYYKVSKTKVEPNQVAMIHIKNHEIIDQLCQSIIVDDNNLRSITSALKRDHFNSSTFIERCNKSNAYLTIYKWLRSKSDTIPIISVGRNDLEKVCSILNKVHKQVRDKSFKYYNLSEAIRLNLISEMTDEYCQASKGYQIGLDTFSQDLKFIDKTFERSSSSHDALNDCVLTNKLIEFIYFNQRTRNLAMLSYYKKLSKKISSNTHNLCKKGE